MVADGVGTRVPFRPFVYCGVLYVCCTCAVCVIVVSVIDWGHAFV